jgi:hypothetical protein
MGKCKIYFDENTEKAIIEYNSTDSILLKNKIYKEKIQFSFEKLAESIINRYNFSYINTSKTNLRDEVVSAFIEKINNYKECKGRAFSYFTVIGKNYLIYNNNSEYKNCIQNCSISEIPDELDYNLDIEYNTDDFIKCMFKFWNDNLIKIFKKKRDQEIVNTILNLFKNTHDIKIFNKKNLYFLIKNVTNSKTKFITKVINIMKKHHLKIVNDYIKSNTE